MSIGWLGERATRYTDAIRRTVGSSPEQEQIGRVFKYPVFVINLERSPYRRAFMCNQLGAHEIKPHVFKAVDGKLLDKATLEADGIYDDGLAHEYFSRSLSLAEIACTWSHIKVSELILERQDAMALVLEDDAMLRANSGTLFRAMMEELPSDWDLVQLFYDTYDIRRVAEHVVRFTYTPRMPIGARGYLINLSGAKKIVDSAYPIKYPADSFIGRSYRWGVNIYGSRPPLISSNDIFPTQIPSRQRLHTKIKEQVKSVLVAFLYSISRNRKNRPGS